ncbi:hypothetical protein P152DRAFT_158124 [Eremomyces bilateralis CBS 781.70]|uniref:Uncharacterized protein n=1 Tax=Eremomyces bilateralis CBS 781.70 TaxID=1392243 RepID=A0A6G1FUI3_9PEZI|nr:uncharacterized protein P152DRAFT_158124 [Eremomyces bilateralis CBS 781.70]KAF1809467.1 hypothetical protein P152DRAFT_158124 [Eremomyces bilateralis CBS 781.70]
MKNSLKSFLRDEISKISRTIRRYSATYWTGYPTSLFERSGRNTLAMCNIHGAIGGHITIIESPISNSDIFVDAAPVNEEGQAPFIELLASYSRLLKKSKGHDRNAPDPCPRSICVLCDPTGRVVSFSQHLSLMRHFLVTHLRHSHLDKGHKCPVPDYGLTVGAGVSPFYSFAASARQTLYSCWPSRHRTPYMRPLRSDWASVVIFEMSHSNSTIQG